MRQNNCHRLDIPWRKADGTDSLYVKGTQSGRKSDGKSTFVREGYAERISQLLEKCNAQLLSMKRDCDGYRLVDDIDMLVQPLTRLHGCDQRLSGGAGEGQPGGAGEPAGLLLQAQPFPGYLRETGRKLCEIYQIV